MTWDEENKCYKCPEGQTLELKQIYHEKDRDRIVYYGNSCHNCPTRQQCLTKTMNCKVITDYISDSTEKLKYRMETLEAQKGYKDRMPKSESKFAFNKQNLKYT